MEFTVREADWADGEAVRDVHVAAIEGLAARAYDDEVVAAWAGGREPDDYPIDARETHFLVAESGADPREAPIESGANRLIGFGALNCEPGEYFERSVDGEITAVYVRPNVAREGVGSRIYAALEERARAAGMTSLGLWASVNALPFYEAQGFERVADRRHEFAEGVEGPAVEMRKALGP